MLPALNEQAGAVRILRRQSVRETAGPAVRVKRPSVLDPRLRGDPWIVRRHNGKLALCFDVWEMTGVLASPLDLPSLNTLLHRVRHRYPRAGSAN